MNYLNIPKDREFDMILLGRIAIDFNPVDYYKTLEDSTTFRKYLGGSPANIAVGLSRLGKKSGFFARVSDDRFGDFVINYFKNCGIDTSKVRRCTEGEKLGLTFTEILSENESSILMYRNGAADLKLCCDDIEEDYIKRAGMLLISGTALCESPSREAALKAMNLAKKNNIPLVFDIDYRPYNWKSYDEIAIYYATVAAQSDIILGSREEFDLTERFLPTDGTDLSSAAYWHGCGAKILVIKHGKEGSKAYTNDGKIYSVRPIPVKALKSFGGGDGYASSFLYGVMEGLDIKECLELATASASMLVSSHSCADDMPKLEPLKAFLAEGKEKCGEVVTEE